jgi:hypothetical protein
VPRSHNREEIVRSGACADPSALYLGGSNEPKERQASLSKITKRLASGLQAPELLARLTGFEPVAYCLEGSCSIQLSYRRTIVYPQLYIRNVDYMKLAETVSTLAVPYLF